ncbi:hypothetical protein [Streptomyces harbinensis]|nr:hypothetical protein [Streptomyces harbinensis]
MRQLRERRQLRAATSGIQLPAVAAAPASVVLAEVTVSTLNARDWLADNAIPLGIAFIGAIIVFSARKKDHGSTMEIVGLACVGLAVFSLAFGTLAQDLGSWLRELVVS